MVEISCPYCDFSKDIPEDRIPEKARWAHCPRCRRRFEINPGDRADPIPDHQSAGLESDSALNVIPRAQGLKPGFRTGLFQTLRQALFAPRRLFGTTGLEKGYGETLAFGLLFGSVGAMLGLFWQFLFLPNRYIRAGKVIFGHFDLNIIFLGLIMATPLFVIIQLFLASFLLHLGLVIFRGGKKGFAGTFRVISYSQAAEILSLIPFVGGFIGFFWRMIIQIIGLKEVHETSYGRVIPAYFLPVVLFLFFGLFVVVLFLNLF